MTPSAGAPVRGSGVTSELSPVQSRPGIEPAQTVAAEQSPRAGPLLALLLTGFVLCALLYSLVAPLWEASDESEHFQYVVYLVQHHALPSRLPTIQPNGNNEGNQPPLYYALVAPLAAGLDLSDAARIRMNPHLGWPGAPDGKAAAAHLLDEGWPYRGAFLAAHRVRALSALLGALTLGLTSAIAATVTQKRRTGLFAAALMALLPGFLYASATIDNDALVDLLSTALLLLVLGAAPGTLRRSALAFGVISCLALLTKLDALIPVAVGAVALLLRAAPRERRATALLMAAPLLPALAFWVWRRSLGQANLIGDRVTWPPPLPGSIGPPDWSLPWRFVADVWTSFIGAFGRQNVLLPHWLYALYGAVFLGGLAFAAFGARHSASKDEPWKRRLLWWWSGLVLAAIVARYFTLTGDRTGYASSRFLYPALPAIATLTASGWSLAARRLPHLRRLVVPAMILGAVLALAYPFWVIRPAYGAPYPIDDRVPAPATAVADGTFLDSVTLAGVQAPASVSAGQGVFVTFYWRVQRPLPEGTWLFVHVEDGAGHRAAAFDGVPLAGTLPLAFWRAGDVVLDREVLTFHPDALPGAYVFRVGWYDHLTGRRVPLASGGSEAVAAQVQVRR